MGVDVEEPSVAVTVSVERFVAMDFFALDSTLERLEIGLLPGDFLFGMTVTLHKPTMFLDFYSSKFVDFSKIFADKKKND
ncbi:MAG: hypothetical protein N0C90_00405, partial [Candidatus Thiodiazotropha endolucinida]|nr:hypothetical protein [Candidatus Thiodiazotropha taylori]MCW4259806.1 hypothetical protein [Candidatus Thiodiazotropha endolucinida]